MARTIAPALRVRAHAKINISLRVVGRRADGYHELRTVFQSLALHDTVIVEPARGPFRLSVSDPSIPGDESNIVWRAAESMWRAAGRRGRPSGVRIHIAKHLPAGGGLAGGSTDAAAALRALAQIWGAPRGGALLEDVARELGADVPYFLYGGTALGLDRGDRIVPLPDLPARWVVLGMPGFGVSTAEAFDWFDRRAAPRGSGPPARIAGVDGAAAEVINDLEAAVAARHPEIGRLEQLLLGCGASAAAMTGSGSTVFGLFATERAAERAAAHIGAEFPARVSRFLDRSRFTRASRPMPARGLPETVRIG